MRMLHRGPSTLAAFRGEVQSRRRIEGCLPLSSEAWSYPAIAVLKEDAPRPAELMGDKTFRDALGEFTLRERRHAETGDLIEVWIEIDGGRALFQPQDWLVEKSYRFNDARNIRKYLHVLW